MDKNQSINNNNNNNGNNKDVNNNDTKSVVLNLETLSKEYDTVLIKYNQAQKNYVNYLKNQSSNNYCSKYTSDSTSIDQDCYNEIWKKAGCTTTNKFDANNDKIKNKTLNDLIYNSFLWATTADSKHRNGCYGSTTDTSLYSTATEPNYNINSEPLTNIKSATFWGEKELSEGEATSIEQCQAMCFSDSSCSGATYNLDKAYCWTRTGEGTINVGQSNDYAIIPENLKYLKVIQALSEKLTNINSKILKTINKGKPLYSNQEVQIQQQTDVLNKNYKKLTKEREKVEKTIKKYQDLNKSQNNSEGFINQQYMMYFVLIIIILITIFLFIKFSPATTTTTIQQGGTLKTNTYYLVFIIFFITFIIWNKILKKNT